MNESSSNTNSQKYIQMSNLSSGSNTRSSFRSNLRTSDLKFENSEPSNAVYNLPWDVKMKQNALLAQISQSSVPPPLPSVPPPSTGKAVEKEPQDETQYCAPWDLKLQEEMLKLMTQKKKDEDASAKPSLGEEPSSEYSPPWEHKQNLIFQQMANSSKNSSQLPTPLATSSASSTLTTTQNSTNLGTIFNKLSLNRLSSKSNNSSASSTRSSTSSLSTNSPPSMPPPPLPPPTLPPPPPPPSSLPTSQQSPLLSHRVPTQPASSNYLNDKNIKINSSHNQTTFFDSMGSNSSSSGFEDSKQFVRQNRAGSSHHFSYPQQFQTIAADGLPVTALVFSQTGSLPNSVLPINVHHNHSQLVSQIPSPNRYDLERQPWFHGRITRKHAENMLFNKPLGSFLVRQSESGNSNDYSLSLVSGSGCVHMRICMKNGEFILGQCSQPFSSIVKMIDHYGRVEVPIKGAQHVKLSVPITPN